MFRKVLSVFVNGMIVETAPDGSRFHCYSAALSTDGFAETQSFEYADSVPRLASTLTNAYSSYLL
jgi:hypothetical protein